MQKLRPKYNGLPLPNNQTQPFPASVFLRKIIRVFTENEAGPYSIKKNADIFEAEGAKHQ